jgi:hypothetical protein
MKTRSSLQLCAQPYLVVQSKVTCQSNHALSFIRVQPSWKGRSMTLSGRQEWIDSHPILASILVSVGGSTVLFLLMLWDDQGQRFAPLVSCLAGLVVGFVLYYLGLRRRWFRRK